MMGEPAASVEDRVQCSEEIFNIKAMGDGTLRKSFILGAHAPDAAKVEGRQDLDNLGAFAHHFMKCHIPGNCRHFIVS